MAQQLCITALSGPSMGEKSALAGAILFTLASVLVAIAAIENPPLPLARVTPATRDFGVVEAGAVLSSDFEFNNLSTKTLYILHVGTDCGCTAAIPATTELVAGAGTTLSATVRAGEYAGNFERHILVQYRLQGEKGSHVAGIPLRLSVSQPPKEAQ